MTAYPDLSYLPDGSEKHKLDVFLPETKNFSTIIWFHGGGLTGGSRKDPDYPGIFTAMGFGFVSAEYRLYPEAKFPDFAEDAAAAVAYTLDHAAAWGGNGRVFVSGESAGAYLTMLLCLNPAYLTAVGADRSRIDGYLSDSAQMFCHFRVLEELGLDSRLERIDCHAPIFYLRPDMDLPPLLLVCYEDDMTCRPEETALFDASARRLNPNAMIRFRRLLGGHCGRPRGQDGKMLLPEVFRTFLEEVGEKKEK